MTYTVVENTPGYLPEEDEPLVTADLGAAKEYLKERVESYCESLDETEEPFEVWWNTELTYAFVTQPERRYHLGRAFEVLETPFVCATCGAPDNVGDCTHER